MSDLFLMLAQTDAGLSCFAVPRWLPDGTRNAIRIERLKDKLGNRSNASSEIELDGAWGTLLGDEGAGVPTIIRMVNHTRLDCVIGVTGQMRAGLVQAIHHTRHRSAFGKLLAEQPLMQQVLADLAIESEAATITMLRLAAAYDAGDETFSRLATAVAKYWCCKRTPMFAAEALECFGGNGYVETGPMARLFRESPLNGIWEGSGNVICLDVLRAVAREPESLDAVLAEIDEARGTDAGSTGSSPTSAPSSAAWATATHRRRRAGSPSGWRWPAGVVAAASLDVGGGRCILCLAARRRGRADVRRVAGRSRHRRDHRSRVADMSVPGARYFAYGSNMSVAQMAGAAPALQSDTSGAHRSRVAVQRAGIRHDRARRRAARARRRVGRDAEHLSASTATRESPRAATGGRRSTVTATTASDRGRHVHRRGVAPGPPARIPRTGGHRRQRARPARRLPRLSAPLGDVPRSPRPRRRDGEGPQTLAELLRHAGGGRDRGAAVVVRVHGDPRRRARGGDRRRRVDGGRTVGPRTTG